MQSPHLDDDGPPEPAEFGLPPQWGPGPLRTLWDDTDGGDDERYHGRRRLADGLARTAAWVQGNSALVGWVRPDAGALCCVRLKPSAFDDAAVDRFYGALADRGVRVGNGVWFGDEPRVFRLGFGLLPAPDLDAAAIKDIAQLLLDHGIDGVIATNTTIMRQAVEGHPLAKETGGLSGRPVFSPSTEVLRQLNKALKGNLPIIGVGGILSGADAAEKMNAGASLVQLYTGLIYRGPELVGECVRAALARRG